MFWADDQISIPNNYFSAIVQLKSFERGHGKDSSLKEQSSTTICDDLSNGHTVESKISTSVKTNQPMTGSYHTTQFFTRTNSAKYDESSTAHLNFMAIHSTWQS